MVINIFLNVLINLVNDCLQCSIPKNLRTLNLLHRCNRIDDYTAVGR